MKASRMHLGGRRARASEHHRRSHKPRPRRKQPRARASEGRAWLPEQHRRTRQHRRRSSRAQAPPTPGQTSRDGVFLGTTTARTSRHGLRSGSVQVQGRALHPPAFHAGSTGWCETRLTGLNGSGSRLPQRNRQRGSEHRSGPRFAFSIHASANAPVACTHRSSSPRYGLGSLSCSAGAGGFANASNIALVTAPPQSNPAGTKSELTIRARSTPFE